MATLTGCSPETCESSHALDESDLSARLSAAVSWTQDDINQLLDSSVVPGKSISFCLSLSFSTF